MTGESHGFQDGAVADGGYETVPLSDWEAVEAHLRRFADGGRVVADEERIALSVGSARFAVTREGHVETGMPLHEFTKDEVESLRFDHGSGVVQVHGADGLAYEFRHP